MNDNDFADFLDYVAMGLSSGMVLDHACRQAAQILPEGELTSFHLFDESSIPMQNPRLSGMISIIRQAYKNGAPLQDILMEQAEFLREEHLWALEQKTQTLGVRLLFPILLFIFPGIFILLAGSLYLQISAQGFLF